MTSQVQLLRRKAVSRCPVNARFDDRTGCMDAMLRLKMECGYQERASTATTSIVLKVQYGDRNPLCAKIAAIVLVWMSATHGSQGWVAKGARRCMFV